MIHLNTQPIEKLDHDIMGKLDIISIFATIQGEGPFTGMPAIFVRTAGCNLQCLGCDTDYTSLRRTLDANEAASLVDNARLPNKAIELAVITGGEPFRQNVNPFIHNLLRRDFIVQVETNGTYHPTGLDFYDARLFVVCSPKTPIVNHQLVPHIHSWKYIIEAGHVDPKDGLPTSVLGMDLRPARPPAGVCKETVFIQPMDTGDPLKNEANLMAALASCREFGFRISLQIHKLLNLP